MLIRNIVYKEEMSQVFVVIYGEKKRASFLENRVCKKGQMKVTLFPGMVFQERILFLRKLKLND